MNLCLIQCQWEKLWYNNWWSGIHQMENNDIYCNLWTKHPTQKELPLFILSIQIFWIIKGMLSCHHLFSHEKMIRLFPYMLSILLLLLTTINLIWFSGRIGFFQSMFIVEYFSPHFTNIINSHYKLYCLSCLICVIFLVVK